MYLIYDTTKYQKNLLFFIFADAAEHRSAVNDCFVEQIIPNSEFRISQRFAVEDGGGQIVAFVDELQREKRCLLRKQAEKDRVPRPHRQL